MCLPKYNDPNMFIVIVIALQVAIYCVDVTLPYENKDLYKATLDPKRYFIKDLKQNQNLGTRSVTTHKKRTTVNNSVTESSINHVKKWQVGRVSRRQYEIINMLWRKTKVFDKVDMSTASYHPEYSPYRLPFRLHSTLTTSTPSFIEFYYLDENDEHIKDSNRKQQLFRESRSQHLGNSENVRHNYPIFAFHINNRNYERFVNNKHIIPNTKTTHKIETLKSPIREFLNSLTFKKINTKRTPEAKIPIIERSSIIKNEVTVTESSYIVDNETCALTTQDMVTVHTETVKKDSNGIAIHRNFPQSTTAYDKIKFFEIYDKQTPLPLYKDEGKPIDLVDAEKFINGNNLNNVQRILLEHVDQSFGNQHSKRHKGNYAKKHIVENNKRYSGDFISENIILQPTKPSTMLTTKTNNERNLPMNESLSSKSKVPPMPAQIINKIAVWSDYSFMAVYIYEPTQVHCDAAGISPHWLITSGSCLSRHHKNPSGEGRSAFVAYCGSSWWATERIAYVKYSVVHPHYRQRDSNRKYMYNIGLIQVVISLTTCPGWAPISLMSHRFVADPEVSTAHAIGWGLDRYDTQYTSADLPKYPLMAYESRVFSDSCPGSLSYIQVKHEAEGNACQNLYCLSLPPYLGEGTDPIHGSMLVVGGKLCAIYLQEERRPSGEQSAEYTGIWRLGPWVSRVAREPDDGDPFTFII